MATVTRDPLRSAGMAGAGVLGVAVVALLVRADVLGAGPGCRVLVLLAACWFAAALRCSARWWRGPVTRSAVPCVTGPPGHQPVPMRRPPKMPPRPSP